MTSGKVLPADASPQTAQRFEELVAAFTNINNQATMSAFLRDICTEAELDAMGQRLQVAALVSDGISYAEISKRTGASTATVTRVAQWLRRGEGGYAAVLQKDAS
jgi:TrpR-related protein YerC/YecD